MKGRIIPAGYKKLLIIGFKIISNQLPWKLYLAFFLPFPFSLSFSKYPAILLSLLIFSNLVCNLLVGCPVTCQCNIYLHKYYNSNNNRGNSVSYTHLDVYKRQVFAWPAIWSLGFCLKSRLLGPEIPLGFVYMLWSSSLPDCRDVGSVIVPLVGFRWSHVLLVFSEFLDVACPRFFHIVIDSCPYCVHGRFDTHAPLFSVRFQLIHFVFRFLSYCRDLDLISFLYVVPVSYTHLDVYKRQ